MKKLLIYLSSDGLINTMEFVFKVIISFFYYKSETVCIYAKRNALNHVHKEQWKDFDCKYYNNAEDVRHLNFERLKLLPYEKWFEEGSLLCVLFSGGMPIAFGWSHFHYHNIKHVGHFDLGNDIAWIGPQFVHEKYRGLGLQKMIVQNSIQSLPDNIKNVITSVNGSNLPSIHSFESLQFHKGIKVFSTLGIFSKNSKAIEIIDSSSLNYLRITI